MLYRFTTYQDARRKGRVPRGRREVDDSEVFHVWPASLIPRSNANIQMHLNICNLNLNLFWFAIKVKLNKNRIFIYT